ncbi:uncharacterized protein LOC133310471 [Gastrolobium bilobum]|uniref:uncharacterized protein LOC133310471 n=1 Tax=Gastrolobium bilobum TaxID=150636 RepID=UPI002AAF64CA|nr:uncharacterized protein LOC133310471 [Gastrolobium bilobum]
MYSRNNIAIESIEDEIYVHHYPVPELEDLERKNGDGEKDQREREEREFNDVVGLGVNTEHLCFSLNLLFSMQLLCFYKHPPPFFASFSRQLLVHSSEQGIIFKKRKLSTNPYYSSSSYCIVHAVKEDSQQYEIDPDEAREALKKLDQQFQSLSNKRVSSSPKLTVSDVKLTKEQASDTEKLGFSESFLSSLAVGLVLFTIFYNVLFYTVIKPSIDAYY